MKELGALQRHQLAHPPCKNPGSATAHVWATRNRQTPRFVVRYGMENVDLHSAIISKVSNAPNALVSGEKPGFQALSKGLIVLLCAEVVRQRVPDHGAVHSECSASNSVVAPPRVAVWLT